MDLAKITALIEFAPPQSFKMRQSFLGLINFSLHFVPNLVAISLPLCQLLQKNTPYIWTPACENKLQQLKNMVRDVVILAHPDFFKAFNLQTNASNGGIGAVLLQQTHMND